MKRAPSRELVLDCESVACCFSDPQPFRGFAQLLPGATLKRGIPGSMYIPLTKRSSQQEGALHQFIHFEFKIPQCQTLDHRNKIQGILLPLAFSTEAGLGVKVSILPQPEIRPVNEHPSEKWQQKKCAAT